MFNDVEETRRIERATLKRERKNGACYERR